MSTERQKISEAARLVVREAACLARDMDRPDLDDERCAFVASRADRRLQGAYRELQDALLAAGFGGV